MENLIEKHRDAKKTLMYDAYWREGICEVLRSIYDDVHDYPDKELKKKITKKLVRSMQMAAKMAERLAYYRETYSDKSGNLGIHLKNIPEYKEIKQKRRARIRKTNHSE